MTDPNEATDRIRLGAEESTNVRINAMEMYMREMKRWLGQRFNDMESNRRGDSATMNEIRERVVRVETRMELQDGALTPGPMHAIKQPTNTNPMNRSVGSFMGDIFMTAIKMVAVGAVAALVVLGFQKSQEKSSTTINNVQAPPVAAPPVAAPAQKAFAP